MRRCFGPLLLLSSANQHERESLLLGEPGTRQDGNHLVISWDRVQALQRRVVAAATITHGSGTSSFTLKCVSKVFLKSVPFFSCEHNNS